MYKADLLHSSMTLQDKLLRLYDLRTAKTPDGKLELGFRPPFLKLLEAFGNPHKNLPPTIHVAGTNGKGSTIAMLRALYEAAGQHVHSYISPHLLRFNERIVLAGQEIEDGPLEALIDEALALNAGRPATFFEVTTVMAFAAFARQSADILLLETGLGGRLDCTNVIESPLATIITRIGLDHQAHLGGTLPEIAAEKAGIMKPGAPCILGPQSTADVESVFEERAKTLGVRLYRAGQDWQIEALGDNQMRFEMGDITLTLPRPNLLGAHQIENTGMALAALHVLGVSCYPDALTQINWPARLQNVTAQFDVPDDWEIIYDGGHNADAAVVLKAQIEQWRIDDPRPLHLIVGMKGDKDAQNFVGALYPYADRLSVVPVAHVGSCLSASDFPEIEAFQAENVRAALAALPRTGPARILICGSLYLAGQVFSQ